MDLKNMKKSLKLYVWRDKDDFDNEFLSLIKPKSWKNGKSYHVGDQDILDLRGNPLKLKKGQIVEIEIAM